MRQLKTYSQTLSAIKLVATLLQLPVLMLLFVVLSSCRMPDNWGFYQPITLRLEAPDGPPAYKTGWYAGCKTALGTKVFQNAFVYGDGEGRPNFGSGIHQHDPLFQIAWGQGWFGCREHTNTFVRFSSFEHSAL